MRITCDAARSQPLPDTPGGLQHSRSRPFSPTHDLPPYAHLRLIRCTSTGSAKEGHNICHSGGNEIPSGASSRARTSFLNSGAGLLILTDHLLDSV